MKRLLSIGLALCLLLGLSSSATATQNEQEADKVYTSGGTVRENPVSVVYTDDSTSRSNVTPDDLSVSANFEQSIFAAEVDLLDDGLANAYADYWSETTNRTVRIDQAAFDLLVAFANDLNEPFVSRQPVDLSGYYDVGTPKRVENLSLVENFAFFTGASFSDTVSTYQNTLEVKDVIPQEPGYIRVDFLLTVEFDNGSGSAIHHTAYLVQTDGGYKVVKFWFGDENFPNFVEYFQSNSTPDTAMARSADLASVGQNLLSERNTNMTSLMNLSADQDSLDKDFVGLGNANVLRGITSSISYDRSQVQYAARLYALSPNPRFEFIDVNSSDKDCTNFVSQCMWQSPGWTFDTIGGHADYKWYCEKNSSGVYVHKTPSWTGVGKLWTYAQGNDSKSLAGTVYGISCSTSGYTLDNIQIGDIIQLSEPGVGYHHSVVVTAINSHDLNGIKVCAHSNNRKDYSLSNYLGTGKMFTEYRIIHVNQFITGYN